MAAPLFEPDPTATVSKAVVRAAERLEMSQSELAGILGLSRATVSRLAAGRYRLAPASKEWELALLLIRLFRSLAAIVGPGPETAAWLRSPNEALGSTPIQAIGSAEGLVRAVLYLDAARARV